MLNVKMVYVWDQIIPEMIIFDFEENDEKLESLHTFIGLTYLSEKKNGI